MTTVLDYKHLVNELAIKIIKLVIIIIIKIMQHCQERNCFHVTVTALHAHRQIHPPFLFAYECRGIYVHSSALQVLIK